MKPALSTQTIARAQASIRQKIAERDASMIEKFLESPLFRETLAKHDAAVTSSVAAALRAFKPEIEKTVEDRVQRRIAEAIEPYRKALEEAQTFIRSTQKSLEGDFAAITRDLDQIKALPVPGGPLVRRMPGMQTGPRVKPPSPEQKAAQLRVDELERQLAWASPVQKPDIQRSLEFARALLRG